jgi:hypothetical protein
MKFSDVAVFSISCREVGLLILGVPLAPQPKTKTHKKIGRVCK